MNIVIIVYLVIAYLFIGMVFSAVAEAYGTADNDTDEGDMWKIPATLFWPVWIVMLIMVFIFLYANDFINYLAKQIKETED